MSKSETTECCGFPEMGVCPDCPDPEVVEWGKHNPPKPQWVGIDLATTPDMTAWKCLRCDAIGTGWPPQPILCGRVDCPARRMQEACK